MKTFGLGGLLALLLAFSARAETPSPHITTDTAEYCQRLATRLHAIPTAATEPAHGLGLEGERQCQTGHVRTGIAKLRRAIRAAQAAR